MVDKIKNIKLGIERNRLMNISINILFLYQYCFVLVLLYARHGHPQSKNQYLYYESREYYILLNITDIMYLEPYR